MPVVNPGIRRLLASAIQRLFNGASFSAPLTHSAIPTRAASGTTGTFTRATPATVTDHEGVLRTAIAGEARFEGARRVHNLINTTDSSEVMSVNDITSFPVTIIPSDIAPPSGYTQADRQTSTGALGRKGALTTWSTSVAAGRVLLMQCVAKAGSGRYLVFGDQADSNWHVMTLDTQTGTVNVVGDAFSPGVEDLGDGWFKIWFRFTKNIAGGVNMLCCHADAATNGAYPFINAGEYWWATGFQCEDITGRADQTTPSEYVSVGVPTDWLGTEHVTNGTFDTDTTGWTAKNTGSLSVVAGKLRVTNGVFGGAEQVITTVAGTKYVLSRNFTAGTSTACITQIGTSAGANDLYDSGIVSTANLSAEFTATSTTSYIQVYLGDGTGGNYADFDNISVKPAIYHGSMVDGVKCFATDLSGNPIPSTTLLGYQAEGARTNLCLQSNAFTTTWVAYLTPSATQNVIGPDGGTTAWTLTDNDPADVEEIYQDIAITAAAYTFSVFIKKTTGAQSSYPALRWFIPGLTECAACTIDTTNGVATAWTAMTGFTMASGVSASCVSFNSNFWRVSLTKTGTAATHRIELLPAATANATQSTGSFSAAVQGSAVFYGAQVELGSFASSYIATTTIAVTRNADVEAVSTSGNIAAAAGSVYLEYTPTHSPSGTIAFWGTYVDASNYTAIIHDATNLIFRKRIAGVNYDATIANAFVSGTTYKACATWGASGTSITLNGTEGTPHANTTAAQIAATMQWGADGNSLQQPFASVRNCRDWLRQLSASERAAVTA